MSTIIIVRAKSGVYLHEIKDTDWIPMNADQVGKPVADEDIARLLEVKTTQRWLFQAPGT